MKRCCHCGNFLEKADKGRTSVLCLKCNLFYCEKCTKIFNTCDVCRSPLIQFQSSEIPQVSTKAMDSKSLTHENRKNPRKDFNTTIEYFFTPTTVDNQKEQTFKGVTRNISDSGFCMYTLNAVKKGQELKIQKNLLLRNRTSAVVQWVKKVDDDIFSTGLMFTS